MVKLTDKFIKHIEVFYSNITVLYLNAREYCIIDPDYLLDKRIDIALGILDGYVTNENLKQEYDLVHFKKITKSSYDYIIRTKEYNKDKL